MSATALWVCVLAACVLGYATKFVGYLVPESLVDGRRRSKVIGLLPVVGVPLPLISYGGTSAVSLLVGFGMLMSIQTNRKLLAN